MTDVRTHKVATIAYERVHARKAAEFSDDFRKKYGALAHKLPGLVLQNGLAQATGFLLAKGTKEHLAVLSDLADTLRQTGIPAATSGLELHQHVLAADLERTMLLTRRTLEASGWMKRYVQGVLGVDATGSQPEPAADQERSQ